MPLLMTPEEMERLMIKVLCDKCGAELESSGSRTDDVLTLLVEACEVCKRAKAA